SSGFRRPRSLASGRHSAYPRTTCRSARCPSGIACRTSVRRRCGGAASPSRRSSTEDAGEAMSAPLDPDRPIRWGILGAGAIAATMAREIAASGRSEVVAVGSRDADRAAAFAQAHGMKRSHGSYAELVADGDIDVIYIATTHAQHRDHALLALRADKPVLVEK